MVMHATVGNWRVDSNRLIGKGGYSRVYLCESPGDTAEQAAIKIFNKTSSLNTFEREVKTLTAISGVPHTPRLIDSGVDSQGRLFIVTELAAGLSLNAHVQRNGPLTYAESRSLIQNLLDLLRQVHSKGLVHLDIGPPNIVVNEDDCVLLDWGGSEWSGERRLEVLRANREIVAPECCFGDFGPAADFYALGLIAVYAMSGKWPYDADAFSDPGYKLLAHCLERPILPEEIPQEFRSLVYSWLNKNPEKRQISYDLEGAVTRAEASAEDFLYCKEARQLQHEFSYLQVGAMHDIPYMQYEYARQLLDDKRWTEGIYWLQRASRQGSTRAASRLALLQKGKRSP